MSTFVPTKHDLRTSLIFCFHLKKNASQARQMLIDAYGQHALSSPQCQRWLNKFKSGDFNVKNEERGRPPKKFEDDELRALLDEDGTLTQVKLAKILNVTQKSICQRLRAMGMVNKMGKTDPKRAPTTTVADRRPLSYPCDEPTCNKTFSNRLHMRAHWHQEHPTLQDRQFLCDRCSLPLSSNYKLQQHIEWHERNPKAKYRPLQVATHLCEVPACGRKYVQRQTLVQHYRKLHPDVAMPERSTSAVASHMVKMEPLY